MINNILDNAKADFNALTLDIAPNKMMTVIRGVWGAMGYMVTQKKLNGEIYSKNRIPRLLCFDQARLTQIIMSLLANSLKHTEFGFIRIVLSSSPYISQDQSGENPDFSWGLMPFGSPKHKQGIKNLHNLQEGQNENRRAFSIIYSNTRPDVQTSDVCEDDESDTTEVKRVLMSIQVIDSGRGMEESVAKQIMNGGSQPNECNSMGLGLKITSALVKRCKVAYTFEVFLGKAQLS
jgi:signal transduction histidine kinase